jgi:predicted esterase
VSVRPARRTEARQIPALVHGTYLLAPPEAPGSGAAGAPLLVGFHGYGENAERHLAELGRIPGSEGWLLCAVQALHPFYNQKTGEVVASWMTRLDRERAIADNVRYSAGVVAEVRRELGAGETLVYAGFSQGVAMAYRAAAAGEAVGAGASHGLIVVGGDVPPELADRDLAGFPPVLLGRGTGDTWYTDDKLERDLALLAAKGVRVRPLVYQGGHEWTEELRRAAGAFLAEVLGAGGQERSREPYGT